MIPRTFTFDRSDFVDIMCDLMCGSAEEDDEEEQEEDDWAEDITETN